MSAAPVVLMYHGLGTVPAHQDPDNLFVPVDTFARQVDRLLQRGYHVLGEREFIAWLDGAPTPSRSALLTFDDGLVSVLEDAAPLLAERGLPSIAYVSPVWPAPDPARTTPRSDASWTTPAWRRWRTPESPWVATAGSTTPCRA